jgi:regulator of replication initiation timing
MSDTPRDIAIAINDFLEIDHLKRQLAAMTAERDGRDEIIRLLLTERDRLSIECAELRQLLRIYCSENIEDKLRESLKLPPRSQP